MADAAHLTSAISDDKPSIFEVLAQESLISTIRPAIKHAARVLAEHRPDRYSWLLRYYDEIYTSLDFLLEYYYLKKYSASFAENFYSLKRISEVGGNETSKHLPKSAFWKSLVCIVLMPYVKQKLDEKFEELRHKYNTYTGNRGMSQLSRAFVSIYPYVHTAWEGSILGYQTAYMFNKSDWHSPFLRISGVRLCMDMEDQSDAETPTAISWKHLSIQGRLLVIMKRLFNMTAVTLSTSLSMGMFFIQFLDWWYANDSTSKSLTSLPVPDPPQQGDVSGEGHYYGVCPVCHKTRSNDTALSVSGYVFCYPCVYDYVLEYKKCPVTNYPAKTEHLIKLYISDS